MPAGSPGMASARRDLPTPRRHPHGHAGRMVVDDCVVRRRAPPGDGGVAAVMDSGGALAMFLDYAEELRIPIARFGDDDERSPGRTARDGHGARRSDRLLGGDADRHGSTEELICRLAQDADTAAGSPSPPMGSPRPQVSPPPPPRRASSAAARTAKPIIAATYTSRQMYPELLTSLARAGIPTLDGMRHALVAVRHAMDRRDFTAESLAPGDRTRRRSPRLRVADWRGRLVGAGR